MANSIPNEAVGASVGVLLYSVVCWILCTMLVGLLITFGEKLTFVTIHSCFTSLSTLASIAQQIFFAVEWRLLKEAEFDKAIRALSLPGLSFVGGAHPVDMALYFVQFWCYNTMALNIFFWTVDLFTSSWGLRTPWLGDWLPRIGPIAKVFSVIFPSIIIGLMNSPAVVKSGVATFIIANGTIFLTLSTGSILLVLILYKYMRTRRLAMGGSRRGGWWASRDTKSQQSRDVGSNYIVNTANFSTRSSIYDRALLIRFSIGFIILAFFLAAIVVFSYISSTTNKSIALAGRPDFSTKSAITDIILFMPGVTASLVTFLVFGTAKSWRQYRDLFVGGCGLRNRYIQRNFMRQRDIQREDEPGRGGGVIRTDEVSIEFTTLPQLNTTFSQQERAREQEASKRVQMFSTELRRDSTHTNTSRGTLLTEETLIMNAQKPGMSALVRESVLSYHQREVRTPEQTGKMQFHRPRPSLTTGETGMSGLGQGSSNGVKNIEAGFRMGVDDQVVQAGLAKEITHTPQSPLAMNSPTQQTFMNLESRKDERPSTY